MCHSKHLIERFYARSQGVAGSSSLAIYRCKMMVAEDCWLQRGLLDSLIIGRLLTAEDVVV